ncbi:MAG: dihydroorotase [Ginsengibacter sp.]
MKVLIKKAKILSPSSSLNGQISNILIENGFITEISNAVDTTADQVVECDDLHVSPGWMDCFANFCDPGQEYKETLETGAIAAAAGGFTRVMVMPDTKPPVDTKSQVDYIIQKSHTLPAAISPVAAITKGCKGTELAEMYDMFQSGAIAFSDGLHPVQSTGMLHKALQYLLAIDATIIQLPDDKSLAPGGPMNEGVVSTRLGLQGKPALAEELLVARDIELSKYTGGKIHLTGISTKKSVELIAAAKKENIRVSCSVTPYHLFFSDEDLYSYETNLKVNPPLRTPADREALREGIKSGIIDFIASHHQPQDWDHKICEFEYAKDGMEGLESVYGAAMISGITPHEFVKMQTENIRRIFNLPTGTITKNEPANLTLFTVNEKYILQKQDIFSKSSNNAFIGKTLKGRVIGIINGEKVFLPALEHSHQ